MAHKAIDVATAGSNTIVAGVAGQKVRLLGYMLVAANTNTVQWLSNATELTGPMTAIAGVQIAPPQGPFKVTQQVALMVTAPGDPLVLTLGVASQVSGHIYYEMQLV